MVYSVGFFCLIGGYAWLALLGYDSPVAVGLFLNARQPLYFALRLVLSCGMWNTATLGFCGKFGQITALGFVHCHPCGRRLIQKCQCQGSCTAYTQGLHLSVGISAGSSGLNCFVVCPNPCRVYFLICSFYLEFLRCEALNVHNLILIP